MTCPTCDHTMQRIETATFWCPRCGTLKTVFKMPEFADVDVPQLVDRTRQLREQLEKETLCPTINADEWNKLGLFEAIYLPDEREKHGGH